MFFCGYLSCIALFYTIVALIILTDVSVYHMQNDSVPLRTRNKKKRE
jgi:hypothetical protein